MQDEVWEDLYHGHKKKKKKKGLLEVASFHNAWATVSP
jgi:hypothetical protein